MDYSDFSICDEVENDKQAVYETIIALLDENSYAYHRAFGPQLMGRVSSLVKKDVSN